MNKPPSENRSSEPTIYSQFSEYLQDLEKQRCFGFEEEVEKHHIIPKHTGYLNNVVVRCSPRNHTLAHFYRFLVYKEKGDWVAYSMRKNQKIGLQEKALLAVEKNKRLGINFWNSEWQKTQGQKGGLLGGSKNTIKQKKARQQVGLKYGLQIGMQNQSPCLKKILSKQTIWLYEKNNLSCFITIPPQQSFSNLINLLQSKMDSLYQEKHSKTFKKINKSSFFKVLYGERLQMYGWKLWFLFF
uniref:Putative site-specific DNA endonuclease n=1 Tax=Tupiella akineta TaxID=160070 RepID=Q3ZJ58_TUPAK|nr:putative site-specific DNA endonuclease [Tupiella akineta]AAV80633.1 putative site-specific DNA endonuclease [Tupiella akineta]